MYLSVAGSSSATLLARAGLSEPSARQREWDDDQAAWEARLRALAGRAAAEQIAPPELPPAPTMLEPAGRVRRTDALILPRSLPAFVGTERGDLACARCSAIIGRSITPRTARRKHPEGDRLVVRCTCGDFNLVHSNRAERRR